MQGEIEQAAFEYQQQVEAGERVIVGVNAFAEEPSERIELQRIDPAAEARQLERTARVRAERNAEEAAARLAAVRAAARGTRTCSRRCARRSRALHDRRDLRALREEWGTYDAVR